MILLLALSCNRKNVCIQKKYLTGKAGFYYIKNDTLFDTVCPKVWLTSDTLLNEYSSSASSMRFHLSSIDSVFTAVVRWDTTAISRPDTLTFYYKKTLHYISPACAYNYFYTIDSLKHTNNNIDSIAIENSLVDDDINKEHIKIIF